MFVLNRALKKTKLAQNYNLISQTLSGGCFYVHGFNKINYFTRKKSITCSEEHQEKRKNNFLKKEESIVIIGGRLPLYLNGDNVQINRFYDKKSDLLPQDFFINNDGISFKDGVKNSIEDLLNKGAKIILIYPVPVLNFNPPKKIFDSYIFDKKNFKKNLQEKPFTISYNSFLKYAYKSHELYNSIKHPNIYKIFTHEIFCDKKKNICKTHDENNVFYRDDNHLSIEGNNQVIKLIFKKIHLIENNKEDYNY